MKTVLLLALAALLVPVTGLDAEPAQAHPPPPGWRTHHHPHPYGHHYRPWYGPVYRPRWGPVLVVPSAPPPPVVYYEPPPPRRVIVVREPPVEVARAPEPVVHEAPPPPPRRRAPPGRDFLGVGIHGSGVAVEGEKVGISAAENPTMGGIGLHLRGRFSDSFGLELSVDFLTGSADDAELEQSSIPVMAGLTWHILPDTRFQPYLIGGVGVHFTRLEYFGGDYAIDLTELAGQLGGGVEFFITENLAIHADLRFQTVFKNLDTKEKIASDCIQVMGVQSGFCDNIHFTDGADKVDLGVQLQAGVSWYF